MDPSCLEHVRRTENLIEENCIIRDFLTLSPEDIPGAPFSAVIGNLPYVRHHWFNGTTRKAARAAMIEAGLGLPATASAWAYFLVHALRFLGDGGRLAMLVPEAILQADYAAVLRNLLPSRVRQRLLGARSRPPVRMHRRSSCCGRRFGIWTTRQFARRDSRTVRGPGIVTERAEGREFHFPM